jgi:hypothetical protein
MEGDTGVTTQAAPGVQLNLPPYIVTSLPSVDQHPVAIPPERPKPRGVQGKILELMRLVHVVAKGQQADHTGGRYAYRGIDDALNAVGDALREVGLLVRPVIHSIDYETERVVNGTKTTIWTSARVSLSYVFTDPVDGSEFAMQMVGEARDLADKATGKAVSVATREALLKGLMVPVAAGGYEDAEASHPEVSYEPAPPVLGNHERAQLARTWLQKTGLTLAELDEAWRVAERDGLLDESIDASPGATLRMVMTAVRLTLAPDDRHTGYGDTDDQPSNRW